MATLECKEIKYCYGIKDIENLTIQFQNNDNPTDEYSNSAIIYAPNGTMKSSFAKLFLDIRNGEQPTDQIFTNNHSSYNISYDKKNYIFDEKHNVKDKVKNIYVIKSFENSFNVPKVSTKLMVDEKTKHKYDMIVEQYANIIQQFKDKIKNKMQLNKTHTNIEKDIINDFGLSLDSDWPDIFEKLHNELINIQFDLSCLDNAKYDTCTNDKIQEVLQDNNFQENINIYLKELNELISNSEILNNEFNDYNARKLTDSIKTNNLFKAGHKITLKNNQIIDNFDDWNRIVTTELNKIFAREELKASLKKIQSALQKNSETREFSNTLKNNQQLILLIKDTTKLKQYFWIRAVQIINESGQFDDWYKEVKKHAIEIDKIYNEARNQTTKWEEIVKEFNDRFKVPFTVKIRNKSNVLLKEEAPNLEFEYKDEFNEGNEIIQDIDEEQLYNCLSLGEKRALYLLFILFDINLIQEDIRVSGTSERYLIIADDIADSFDYKNKYAILEYLNDLVDVPNIDLLLLTHNFDFYRNAIKMLKISIKSQFIVQKNNQGALKFSESKYRDDYLKSTILIPLQQPKLKDRKFNRSIIASIPLYRNLSYYGIYSSTIEKKFTHFLHIKAADNDINIAATENLTMKDLIDLIKTQNNKGIGLLSSSSNRLYLDVLFELSDAYSKSSIEIELIEKIVLTIGIRLMLEKCIINKLGGVDNIMINGKSLKECNANQTRELVQEAKRNHLFTNDDNSLIEEAQIISNEGIHLNSFSYEPLIDVSGWKMQQIYQTLSEWEK